MAEALAEIQKERRKYAIKKATAAISRGQLDSTPRTKDGAGR